MITQTKENPVKLGGVKGQSGGFSFNQGSYSLIEKQPLSIESILHAGAIEKALIKDLFYNPDDEKAWVFAREKLYPFHFHDPAAAIVYDVAQMLRDNYQDFGFLAVKAVFIESKDQSIIDWLDGLIILPETHRIAAITLAIYTVRTAWHKRTFERFLRERPTMTDSEIQTTVSQLERFGVVKLEQRRKEVLNHAN